MEKLEQVLNAEESARQVLATAQEHADSIRSTAVAEGARLTQKALDDARAQGAALRQSKLELAGQDATASEDAATQALKVELERARALVDTATAAALSRLVD